MNLSRFSILLVFFSSLACAQTVSSSVNAVIVDSTGAAIPGAACELINQANGARVTATSGAEGLLTFPAVLAGTYTLRVQAAGFKGLEMKDLMVSASEIRALGKLALQVGEVRESVSVTAEVAALQLASAERSGALTGSQINDIALKGRDFFALLQTIPGIVDTKASRETTSNTSNMGININGGRDDQKSFLVDGMVDHDTHSNGSMPFQPNMDSIAEVKVLTSNYQAEYGRNSSGTITVITKSGATSFHGSAYNYYRQESLNANSFFNNRTGTQKLPYRYRISGFSIGGPAYIPKKFNANKEKFFFFWSREYTGVKKDYGTQFVNSPSAAERNGDFSQSRDLNGALIAVRDPQTGLPFPGNAIPKNRLSQLGQSILNFFPLPNYTDPDPRNLYRWNYRSSYSGNTPRRNDMFRFDANLTPSLRVYYRLAREAFPLSIPWSDWKTGSTNWLMDTVYVNNHGLGDLLSVTKSFSPTMVNETIIGRIAVARDFDYAHPEVLARAKMGNPPQWFKDAGMPDYVPNVSFGGQPANTINVGLTAQIPNSYRNRPYTFTDQFSMVSGMHSLKGGISVERMYMSAPVGANFRGNFDFSRNVNNPFDSGHSFANALLSQFSSYSESTQRLDSHEVFVNTEWYVQDNWRVSRRLTLDFGVRFYHMPPIRDTEKIAATFDPALYDPKKAPALYVPARDANGVRVAKDPVSGAITYAALIGQFVPGSGNFANGTAVGGLNGYPAGLYARPWLSFGPRVGFAYDLFGTGKTALRGGWGRFYETGQNNPFAGAVGNPPLAYNPVLYYGDLSSYTQGGGAIGPTNQNAVFGPHKLANNMNFSLGIQHQIWNSVIDVSYVGALGRSMFMQRNINSIPLYARFDPKNEDPTQPGRPLPDNFLRSYRGYGNLNVYESSASSNYNSLQVAMNRRFTRGLQFGLAYTYSKVLGVAPDDTTSVSPYFPARQRNYGTLGYDRSQMLVINYMYDLPKLGRRLAFKPAEWVLDRWQISGITSFISGAPFTPGFGTTDGQDITGSTEGARITVTADPRLTKGDRSYYRNFKTEVFRRTPLMSFGNAGIGILRGPGINNWDLSISKRVPLFAEGRYVQFRTEMFNAWNHTQFSGLFSSARFDTAGNQTDPNFGAYSSARAPRIIQLSLKVIF